MKKMEIVFCIIFAIIVSCVVLFLLNKNNINLVGSKGKNVAIYTKFKELSDDIFNEEVSETPIYDVNLNENEYLIIFYLNNGDGTIIHNIKSDKGENIPDLSFENPVRDGYTFMGWYDNPNYLMGTKYYDEDGRKTLDYYGDNNLILYAGWQINKITFKYNTKGGKVKDSLVYDNVTYNWKTDKDGFIYLNGELYTTTLEYNKTLEKKGFINANGVLLNVYKDSYRTSYHKEWCTKNKKCYSQEFIYKASDFCDLKESDCEVTLYVNWIPSNYVDVDMSNISNCIKEANKTGKASPCINLYGLSSDFTTDNHVQMQNFAITEDYVYFSSPQNGAWTGACNDSISCLGKKLDIIADNHIERISRAKSKNGLYERELNYVKYAGHTQSFDVTGGSKENIFLNGLGYMSYNKSMRMYGVDYAGVSTVTFKSNKNTNGVERKAETTVPILSNGLLSQNIITSKNFSKTEDYYNYIKNFVYKNGVNNSKNSKLVDTMVNPEMATDYNGKKIVVTKGKDTIYYYKDIIEFKKGKIEPYVFYIDYMPTKQAVELHTEGYETYFYIYGGSSSFSKNGSNYYIEKYKIDTDKNGMLLDKEKEQVINVWSYFEEQIKDNKIYCSVKRIEPEGMSIDKHGNVFVGFSVEYGKCDNSNYETLDAIFTIGKM